MTRLVPTGGRAGAYLTGPVMPNPALLGYSASSVVVAPHRPLAFPKTTASISQEPEISDQAVAEAIERLTKSPGDSPEALQQSALDMELVIKHFDSLSAIFGAEAALTSLALDLASNEAEERVPKRRTRKPRRPGVTRRAAAKPRGYAKI